MITYCLAEFDGMPLVKRKLASKYFPKNIILIQFYHLIRKKRKKKKHNNFKIK